MASSKRIAEALARAPRLSPEEIKARRASDAARIAEQAEVRRQALNKAKEKARSRKSEAAAPPEGERLPKRRLVTREMRQDLTRIRRKPQAEGGKGHKPPKQKQPKAPTTPLNSKPQKQPEIKPRRLRGALDEVYQAQLAARALMEARARPDEPAPDLPQVPTWRPREGAAHTSPTVPATRRDLPAASDKPCPVCGNGGVPIGSPRHARCERLARVSDVPQPRAIPAPHPNQGTEYRRLVEAAERREAATKGKRSRATNSRPVRISQAREAVLIRCDNRCENPRCPGQPDDLTDDGRPILEVDHVDEIAAGGRDHPSQMVALCPNCHAVKTRGRTREALRGVLAQAAQDKHAAWLLR
ncbi:HNH endonuclease [Streptomyces sp. NPDC048508]|uniref:HNH endonuclease signature motif containing protein n=1 Tax=Streptomyces sp. NPDC048508 TaxID=3365561 RepID=UPI003720CDF3